MAQKAKYDPLEAAKLGTDAQPAAVAPPFVTPKGKPQSVDDLDVSDVEPPPQRRPRYSLTADKRVSIRGQVCDFKAGRVIDSAGYDIENLKSQGCELELIKE